MLENWRAGSLALGMVLSRIPNVLHHRAPEAFPSQFQTPRMCEGKDFANAATLCMSNPGEKGNAVESVAGTPAVRGITARSTKETKARGSSKRDMVLADEGGCLGRKEAPKRALLLLFNVEI